MKLRITTLALIWCALCATMTSIGGSNKPEPEPTVETTAVAPKMKMTTPIPSSITTPDSVETAIGTVNFFDGFPDDKTTKLVYDNLDFMRVVNDSDTLAEHVIVGEEFVSEGLIDDGDFGRAFVIL